MKTVYTSFLLHGNMCYDRYTKQEIREKFPKIYATGVRAMHKFPEVTAHIDFPGLTLLSLKHHAQRFLDELKPLVARKQIIMVGCQYAASHALCADEESDILAGRVSMAMHRDELAPDADAFFPQEIAFHPQSPYIMNQMGARRLIVMPFGWQRPRRVRGVDGSEVILYPLDIRAVRLGKLEEYYDTHEDGSFVMMGGDFELLGNVEAYVNELRRLADKGKIIKWTTVERYEREVGIQESCDAPNPFGQTDDDRESSPSFSRWVGDPEDIIWHGHAVQAMDAVRSAGFAKAAARIHRLGDVDRPLAEAWTTEPDNAWDHHFEEANEFPETEAKYLTPDGQPTLLSRAWHHLLIGLNSDASGWFPWTPRTRHRNLLLQSSRALSNELLARFANEVASRLRKPDLEAQAWALAINPMPARTAEVSLDVEKPLSLVEADGKAVPTAVSFGDGKWSLKGSVDLPSYGYKLLGLVPARDVQAPRWTNGHEVSFAGRSASLAQGVLRLTEGAREVRVTVAPFRLSDPSGVAATEDVAPTWNAAHTRIRHTLFGDDLEVFTELAWAVWLRLVIGLRADRFEITAEVHVDMPRRIGNLKYDPNGLLLQFTGQPGGVCYDVPFATIRHKNDGSSFIAAQRFAAIESATAAFGLVALGGNQSFKVVGREGILAANLGASTQGRPDTRPQCVMRPDGLSDHKITSKGDPFMGSYSHRFALLFAHPLELALAARRLRTAVPFFRVEPGAGAWSSRTDILECSLQAARLLALRQAEACTPDEESVTLGGWPASQSFLSIEPSTAHVTAFRVLRDACEIALNDLSGQPGQLVCQGQASRVPAFGTATFRV